MGNSLEIEGQFLSIDEGNRTKRVVIGLGAGRTDVKTLVQVYDARFGTRRLLEKFDADAKSGRKPGMAEMMAAGVLTHHLLVSTLASGALAAGSEAFMVGGRVAEWPSGKCHHGMMWLRLSAQRLSLRSPDLALTACTWMFIGGT